MLERESSFLADGYFSPFESAVGNLAFNFGAFSLMDWGADKMKVSLANQVAGKRFTAEAVKVANKPAGFTGFMRNFAEGAFTGDSYGQKVVSQAYEYRKQMATTPGNKGENIHHSRVNAAKQKTGGHGWRATKALFGHKESVAAMKGVNNLGWAAAKEIGASKLAMFSKASAFQLGSSLVTGVGVLADAKWGWGLFDPMGIYTAYGKEEFRRQLKSDNRLVMSQGFYDNRGAATMRQRSLAAIHNTQMNIHQVFGAESTYNHQ